MSSLKILFLFLTFVAAWFGTAAVCRYALARGIMDVPNARSSHTVATPRGGGVAIVGAFIVALLVWANLWGVSGRLLGALVPGGVAVAVVGFMDDRKSLPARWRLCCHFAASAWAVYWLGGFRVLDLGFTTVELGVWGSVLAVIGLAWSVNLYNFMDGIDGLAGGQAVLFGGAGGAILALSGGEAWPAFLLAAASAGFLVLNWPPARVFMGDAGSGFLGFAVGAIALHATTQGQTGIWPWLILMAVFVVDATVTLLRRTKRGLPIASPHRTHGYQWAARRLRQHKIVSIGVLAIGVLALIPSAILSIFLPEWAVLVALVVLSLLTLLALALGAGVPEIVQEADNEQ